MMRSNKFKKVVAGLLVCSTIATAGFSAIACGHKHDWKPEHDTDSHWYVCECGETKDKAPHIDVDVKDGICDVCGATMPSEGTTGVYTITLNANGGTVTTVQTANGKLTKLPDAPAAPAGKEFDGWYTAEEGGTKITLDTTFTANATIYAHWKDAGVTPPPVTEGKNTYTVYLYAPEANGAAVTVSVWGGMVGAFNDGAAMTAVADHAGWYSFEFKTDKEIADGANFNLYVGDEQVATGYTTAADWVYFVAGINDEKWSTMDNAEAAYDELVNGGGEDVETETTTVYFHKPSDWEGSWVGVHAYYGAASTSATGTWGTTHMEVDSDDWYKVDIELPEGTDNFNIIVFDEKDSAEKDEDGKDIQIRKTLNVTNGIGGNVYINANGKAFTTKADAEADETADPSSKKYHYTFYMYAPEATSVTIGVWGNFAGEIADGTVMTAVAGHDGWYSYTLDTDIELKAGNGINLNIFVDGTNKGKYSENTTDLYFIAAGNDRGFTDFETAEAKYAELTAPVDPSDQEDVTITVVVDTTQVSGTIYAYVWGDVEIFEGWPGKALTLVSGNTYSITVTVNKNLSGTIHLIINNNGSQQYDAADITITNGTWTSSDTAVTITKA